MGDLVILVPMLGRPHTVGPLLQSIDATAPHARVLFLVSPHDRAVHQVIDRLRRERMTVPYTRIGDYARKINTGYRATSEPHIFLGACDLRFHPGWYEAVIAKLGKGIGVVGTNDLGSPRVMAGEHATHSLITREYADEQGTVDQPGQVLFEGYAHEFVDDELVGTARKRGAFAFAFDSHVEHLHPSWGKNRPDALYRQHHQRMRHSRPLFETRRALWT